MQYPVRGIRAGLYMVDPDIAFISFAACDMWSLGVCLFHMLAARLIADLLQPQATLRPTVDEALDCAWLQPTGPRRVPVTAGLKVLPVAGTAVDLAAAPAVDLAAAPA
eukprot:gene17163-20411_t